MITQKSVKLPEREVMSTPSASGAFATLAAFAAAAVVLDAVVRVRLAAEVMNRLDRVESYARSVGRRDVNRSSLMRAAIAAYVRPLVEVVDSGALDRATIQRLFGDDPDTEESLGETVRIRLDSDLLRQIDLVEAYARGLGFRAVSRSSLIRAAIDAFLSGLESELSVDPRRELRAGLPVETNRA